MNKKVIAFGASNSSRSINKKLVTYTSGLLDGADVEILDLNDYELPLFSVDQSVLELALSQIPRFGGQVKASVSVPSFGENFDLEAGVIVNNDIGSRLQGAVNSLFK